MKDWKTGWKTMTRDHPPKIDLEPPTIINVSDLTKAVFGAAVLPTALIKAAGATYIGREMRPKGLDASPWANTVKLTADTPAARAEAIRAYLTDLLERSERSEVGSLAGRRLACWCSPKLCHGNGIAELIAVTKWYGAKCTRCGAAVKSWLNWHAGLNSFVEAWTCSDFAKCATWGEEPRPVPSLLRNDQPTLF